MKGPEILRYDTKQVLHRKFFRSIKFSSIYFSENNQACFKVQVTTKIRNETPS